MGSEMCIRDSLKGVPSHKLLQTGIEALTCMTHRGGIAADGKTGDGCGLLIQKPDSFLREVVTTELSSTLDEQYGVGSLMLPRDVSKAETAKHILIEELAKEGFKDVLWREVPVNNECLGPIALDSEPHFVHMFVNCLLYTSPSPRDLSTSRMPSSA